MGDRYRYRTEYELLNSAGAVRHKCQYVAFATPEKVIGLMRTPLDGAGHRYVGIIASAGPILQLDVAYCLGADQTDLGTTFLVSTGVRDCCSVLHELDYPTLDLLIDTAVEPGGDPFMAQL